MRNKFNNSPATGQLRWVILLLAVAVILPTVCLLWFMSQAVKNERLAVRQKLTNIYKAELEKKIAKFDRELEKQAEDTEKLLKQKPVPDIFYSFVSPGRANRADGFILYDPNGSCIYPTQWEDFKDIPELQSDFEQAWELEFVHANLKDALEKFKAIENKTNDKILKKRTQLAKARIYKKKGDIDEAIKLFGKAMESGHSDKGQIAYLRANAQLMYTELLHQKAFTDNQYIPTFSSALLSLLSTVSNYNTGSGVLLDIPSEQRIFLADKALRLYEQTKDILMEDLRNRVELIRNIQAAESLSLEIAEKFPTSESINKWKTRTLHKLPNTNIYATTYKTNDSTALRLLKRDNIILAFTGDLTYKDNKGNIFSSDLDYRIIDAQGAHIYGIKDTTAKPFIKSEFSKYLPGWSIEFFFKNTDVFENAATRQVAFYVWTGGLVIFLIFASGVIATRAIEKQIKLNRLKNDFIATVTHELKTPLSSMRVLVDTLLEGNYNEQQTASEYLRLISKENIRLSRLIDNFLTFSRMERNKQAFDIVKTDPAEIAKAAVEAVQTKFNKKNCKFTVTIDEKLPSIMADKDAMVTVLVNLLDNAYKYTYDNKIIKLRAFEEGNVVCFLVKDNGIGMSRKVIKRIFNRFYQVDSSLSRQAEGTGLGLSIVKFIVDAHKGQIDVDSKPSKGSEFTVKLPTVSSNK